MIRKFWPVILALAVVAGSCGTDRPAVSGTDGEGLYPTPTIGPPDTNSLRYTATATVLESPEHGPQLCGGLVLASRPPQCGGPRIIGWDWDGLEGAEELKGTTWGEYTVVGTWDGQALTLTEPPAIAPLEPKDDPADRGKELESPCATPDGGWPAIDPATTSEEALTIAINHARVQPDAGAVWVDRSGNSKADGRLDDDDDPANWVLNLAFTGDLERHEAKVRNLWGGHLCVSQARMSIDDLADIRSKVEAEATGIVWSSINPDTGRLEIGVVVDDGLQEHFDEQYGAGQIAVYPTLKPVR